MKRTEIPLSKSKVTGLVIVSTLFVAAGCAMLRDGFSENSPFSPMFTKIFGFAGIIFFGMALVVGITRLFSKKPGMVIDEQGISSQSNITIGQTILWEDISHISEYSVSISTKLILIHVYDNEKYLAQISKGAKFLANQNIKLTGTPFSISPNTLAIDYNDLLVLLQEHLTEYQNNKVV